MAVSNSQNYSQNAYSICKDALILIGQSSPDRTPSPSVMDLTRRALNRMFKAWQMQGTHMWTQQEGIIIPSPGVAEYRFSDNDFSSEDYGVITDSSLVQSTFSADEASGQTVLSITDTTGMAASDVVIIELDGASNYRQVTTIVSVDSSTQITVTAALSEDVSEGNYIYAYPPASANFHPMQIYNVRVSDSDTIVNKMTAVSRAEWTAYPNRSSQGMPYSYYIDDQRTYKVLSVYPLPQNMRFLIKFSYAKGLDDIDDLTDDVEFPPEWCNAILWNLAVQIAPFFGQEEKIKSMIAPLAQKYLADALYWDQEMVDVQLTPRTWD